MSELDTLLLALVIAVPAGLIVGGFLRQHNPHWSHRYAQWSLRMPWWFFAAGAAFFTCLAVAQAEHDRPWFVAFLSVCAVLDLIAMGFSLWRRFQVSAVTAVGE